MSSSIDRAFAHDANLKKRVFDTIEKIPQLQPLFNDVADYYLQHSSSTIVNGDSNESQEPSSKKRKLVNGVLPIGAGNPQLPRKVTLEARDISFSLPQRKKLHLNIVQYGTAAHNPDTKFAICTINPSTNEVEAEIPLEQFSYAIRLPVPEKAQKQYNFCLIPKSEAVEPVIWTVNDGPLKSCTIHCPDLEKIIAGSPDVLEKALNFVFERSGFKLTLPDEKEFASATPESHRKGDKAYHVKAFRGSKDGYLFFLENGIFFGFKKPLSFFPFDEIESISYTSVLQRTFNLNISYRSGPDSEPQEIEFSMLDQADFPGIDGYIKRHQLQDASMAEVRRAKKVGVNAVKNISNQNNPAEGEDQDDRTELQKAEQQMEEEEIDEEDELEEDYDPGDEGDSDGSGSTSAEEEDEDEYHHANTSKGHHQHKDLIKEELGSEAEDVIDSHSEPDVEDEDQL